MTQAKGSFFLLECPDQHQQACRKFHLSGRRTDRASCRSRIRTVSMYRKSDLALLSSPSSALTRTSGSHSEYIGQSHRIGTSSRVDSLELKSFPSRPCIEYQALVLDRLLRNLFQWLPLQTPRPGEIHVIDLSRFACLESRWRRHYRLLPTSQLGSALDHFPQDCYNYGQLQVPSYSYCHKTWSCNPWHWTWSCQAW